jgi:hypothetical protein
MSDDQSASTTQSRAWLPRLQKILAEFGAGDEIKAEEQSKEAEELLLKTAAVKLLQDLLTPPISFVDGRVHVPEAYVIRIDGGRPLLKCIFSGLFVELPDALQIVLLDVLHAVLKRSVYDVVRFRCFGGTRESSGGFVRVLIQLLNTQRSNVPIAQRLVRLIGVVALGGIAIHDLKSMLQLLRKPSELSLSVLQALKTALRADDVERKASPSAFFNFGGQGAGLFLPAEGDWPFQREYQVHFWFRLEGLPPRTEDPAQAMHLFTCVSATGNGVDVLLTDGKLRIKVADGEETKVLIPDMPELHPRVWYHFHLLHTRPKIMLFGREELFVHIDHKLVLSKPMKVPQAAKVGEIMEWSIGRNFNGQIGTVWIMHESLAEATVESLANHDAHRGVDLTKILGGAAPPDVNPTAVGEKKSFASKLLAVFHASRCAQHHALDIHGGLHARFGRYTQAWTLVGAREVISSIGGISAILPIFPRLLWENQEARIVVAQKSVARFASLAAKDPARVERYNLHLGLGSPLSALFDDVPSLQYLHPDTRRILLEERDEYKENTPISMLLSIIGRCFRNHPSNQAELLQSGGVDMLEYVLYCLPDEFMQAEGMPAVMAVLRLRSAASGNEQLEVRAKRLPFFCVLSDVCVAHMYPLWACSERDCPSNLRELQDLVAHHATAATRPDGDCCGDRSRRPSKVPEGPGCAAAA